MTPRSALLLAGALLCAVATSCSKDPTFEDRTVYVYAPRACPVSQSDAFSVVYAGGDFQPSADQPPTAKLFLRDVGSVMTELPAQTRSLLFDVSQQSETAAWRGLAEVGSSGPINVLVWPSGQTCNLTRSVENRVDSTLGVFGRGIMVAGGVTAGGGVVPHTFVGDLGTGIVEPLALGLGTRRSHPTITAFREPGQDGAVSALVAGGQDPDSKMPLSTAEVYVPNAGQRGDIGDFERTRIELSSPRAQHGAVVLATGETLLVGGVGNGGQPLTTMDLVDPKTRQSRSDGIALLAVARSNPIVLRLANGEILVASGTAASGALIPTLEWFAPDASRPTKRPIDLVTGRQEGFVPLEGGGALAVIAPKDDAADFKTVWVVSADGTLEAATPIPPNELDVVRLFEGPEGAPLLWTGKHWMRWQPWEGAFRTIDDATSPGPSTEAIASGDKGLALWIDDRAEAGAFIAGFRFATRSRFGPAPNPMLIAGPGGMAPDRLADQPGGAIHFTDRGLELGPGASAFVTDLTFADIDIELDVTTPPPYVVLRGDDAEELEVGGVACAFGQNATRSLSIQRRGAQITVRADDGEPRICPTSLDAGVRIAVGLRGASGADPTIGRNLRVIRR
ncbi:hypothetical protein [Labilithrix luteola]|uniref:hypothetical protein n=1 Tax=Labilithrix luteola TaxID=1391654 RepID=UPI001473D8B2|nr:hypothetical protein [Labilithrix luteola]